jgi:hypothetical protein
MPAHSFALPPGDVIRFPRFPAPRLQRELGEFCQDLLFAPVAKTQ